MTGIVIGSAGTLSASAYRVTIASGGGGAGTVGFVAGTGLGSISSNNFRGKTISEITTANLYNFFFLITTQVAQSFIRQIVVEDGNGSIVKYDSSAAIFAAGGGFSQWEWGNGSARPWVAADATEVRRVIVL